uniref:Forkhead box N1 n=1 Tax=Ornithorhynchus anatinus TaxID=9258 RepID=A0A6I8P573_ORNAN
MALQPSLPAGARRNPGFGCPPYSADSRTERELSDSSHSPSPSSPHQDPLQNRFAPGPGLPNSKAPFHLSPTEKFQSFSYEDGPAGSPNRFLKAGRTPFHPYKRQFPEEVFPEPHQALTLDGRAFKSPAGVEGFEELANPGDTDSFVPGFSSEASWCNGLHYPGQEHGPQIMHGSEVKLKPAAPLEGPPGLYCYQPSVQQMYCPSPPFHHQYSPGASYPVTYLTSSHYPYQRIAPQASPDSQQPLFPKPIYSYSILIFMALKNSKTGSLPVSEIYNFMTEHFPYFKTAPDGWKNSVRHNLSLNKCFEKVENKSGSSSRKGCLWALNPAKIDKMQEELQKWKRKDPVAVRKSMAKPEELDSLIGDKAEKFRPPSLACAGPGLAGPGLPRQMTTAPAALGESAHPSALPQTLHVLHPAPGPLQAKNPLLGGHPPSCYPSAPQGYAHLSPALGQPGGPQTLFPPAEGQGELRAQPSTSQDSPLPAQTPPIHSMKMLTEPSPARTMPDALMPEGDLSNDIDALNPSLTDFDLQGKPLPLGTAPFSSCSCSSPDGSRAPDKHPQPCPELTWNPGLWVSEPGEGGRDRMIIIIIVIIMVFVKRLLCARYCTKCRGGYKQIELDTVSVPWGAPNLNPHSTDEVTEAQRSKVTCQGHTAYMQWSQD